MNQHEALKRTESPAKFIFLSILNTMLNHRSTKTYRLNGRMFMKGTGTSSGSIRFKKAGIKSIGRKVHNFLKKVGPKIVHGGKKLLNWVASDPTVSQMIKNTADSLIEGSGDKVNKIIKNTNDMVKDKKVDINKIKDTIKDTKDIVTKWKDNNKKVQASPSIKSSTKEQVQENTDKLVDAASKGRLGSIDRLKNSEYLNLLTKSTRGGSITTSASVVKEIRDALNLPATSIAQKGRMFLGDLKPKYLLSEIKGNDTSFTKKKSGAKGSIRKTGAQPSHSAAAQLSQHRPQPMANSSKGGVKSNAKSGVKSDIIKKFEALF